LKPGSGKKIRFSFLFSPKLGFSGKQFCVWGYGEERAHSWAFIFCGAGGEGNVWEGRANHFNDFFPVQITGFMICFKLNPLLNKRELHDLSC